MQAEESDAWGEPHGPWTAGLAPGDIVAGKYRLDAILGRGGMSVVYRATHLDLDQPVALKVLSTEALLLPGYVQRLKREARAVSRIRSEHVVRVHDIGQLDAGPGVSQVPYLVMEHLSGLDLAALLARRGPLELRMAVECILQACEALAEAHALDIVHRDLKPANLFLTDCADGSPCVKVLDFGISRMAARHGLSSLTDPGTVLGTPSYMAPEQMEGAAVDCRSDIWALGAILYELLTGKTPYGNDALPKLFVKVVRSPTPRPSHLRPSVSGAIDAVVVRCLAVDPARRFPSVAHLALALSAAVPSARDAARRVTRVLDRRRSEELAGTSAPALALDVAPFAPCPERRSMMTLLAGAGVLGVAAIFGALAARAAVVATSPRTPSTTSES
ncbi:MAG TPA: serine/threonine-protein kinase, partial [Labilithrix sp.]|nr:serine/threonine-protein kinase [Labilithrix sp.]